MGCRELADSGVKLGKWVEDASQSPNTGSAFCGETRDAMTQSGSRPIHERIPPLGSLRGLLRKALFAFLRKLSATDDARGIAADTLQGLLQTRQGLLDSAPGLDETPYPELGRPAQGKTALRADIVIITARFRTGSTLLWNLFRSI